MCHGRDGISNSPKPRGNWSLPISGSKFWANAAYLIVILAALSVSCSDGARRFQSNNHSDTDLSSFLNPAIAGNIISTVVSFHALIIERVLSAGNAEIALGYTGCRTIDSLPAINSFFAEKSKLERISSTIDSIEINIYQGDRQVGKIEIGEYAGSFSDVSRRFGCDTLMAIGNMNVVAGEFQLFGERMKVRQGSMKFSIEICDLCDRELTVLSERGSIRDNKHADPGGQTYSKIASEDARRLHFSDDYAYMVTEMELAFLDGSMSTAFVSYGVFDGSFAADSTRSIASVFITVSRQTDDSVISRQEQIELAFDSQLNLYASDRKLSDLIQ
jgi:hypothetical protein